MVRLIEVMNSYREIDHIYIVKDIGMIAHSDTGTLE